MSAALNAIFALHRRSLLWTVMRIVRDPDTAEDLAQETYIRAKRAFDEGAVEYPEGFLHQTARNLALDHVRRTNVRGSVETSDLNEAICENVAGQVLGRGRLWRGQNHGNSLLCANRWRANGSGPRAGSGRGDLSLQRWR